MKNILALLLIVSTSSLSAGERSACVRVIGVVQKCGPLGCTINSTAFGSAVIVGKYRGQWAALTCEHVTRGCVRVDVQIEGARLPVEQVAYDRSVDLALIVFEHSGELDWSRIADTSPEPGQAVVASGYPSGGLQHVRAARVVGKNFVDIVAFIPAPSSGDSGGGLFRDGQLVGTISATDRQQGYAIPAATIHAFFSRKSITLDVPKRYSRPVDPQPKQETKPDIAHPETKPVDPLLPVPQPPEKPPLVSAPEEPTEGQQDATQNDSAGFPWGAILSTGAAALGVGTPVGLGIAGAGWLVAGIRKRRRARSNQVAQPRNMVQPVPIDSPPLPQQVASETRFAPYQVDDYSQAHAWAREQMARKYPGSTDLLEAEQAMIRQYLGALKK